MAQQLRIALSYVSQRLQEILNKSKENVGVLVQWDDAMNQLALLFRCGVGTLQQR